MCKISNALQYPYICLKPITVIVKPDMSIESTKKVKIFLIWLSHTVFTILKTNNPHMQKI